MKNLTYAQFLTELEKIGLTKRNDLPGNHFRGTLPSELDGTDLSFWVESERVTLYSETFRDGTPGGGYLPGARADFAPEIPRLMGAKCVVFAAETAVALPGEHNFKGLTKAQSRRLRRMIRKMERPEWASTWYGIYPHDRIAAEEAAGYDLRVIQSGLTYRQAIENWESVVFAD